MTILAVLVVLGGCSDDVTSGEAGAATDAGSDLGRTETSGVDVADAASATDAADEATGASDAEADLPPAQDAADVAAELPPVDVAPADVPKTDTAPADTGKPDVPVGDPCLAKSQQYAEAFKKALQCQNFWECWEKAPVAPTCCNNFVSGEGVVANNCRDLEAEWKKLGCKASCAPSQCPDLDTAYIGLCKVNQCAMVAPTCKELETYATQALTEGAKCKADSECTFKASNTLGCGCPTYVNVTTMGPGKPLFKFMTQLAKVYNAKKCTTDVACACPNPNSAKCVGGACKY
jgi:hypothetical protein